MFYFHILFCFVSDTPEKIAHELLGHAIINWRDVPSIAKLMTMGFIQRANETAEYIAKKETIGDDANNHDVSLKSRIYRLYSLGSFRSPLKPRT